jgi:hypothetical protein
LRAKPELTPGAMTLSITTFIILYVTLSISDYQFK